MEKITFDEGYTYGLGVFETIAVEKGKPVFLDRHLKRLEDSLVRLKIHNFYNFNKINKGIVMKYLEKTSMDKGVLKIIISEENIHFSTRQNPYCEEDYKRGFYVGVSQVLRNETSPLTYMKTLNYGDNILEKRRAKDKGIDEPVFLNTKGQLTEGATSNMFFITKGLIHTTKLSCGMLKGIIRDYVMENYPVVERIIYPDEIPQYDEMFLTNSLFGIMPVIAFNNHKFSSNKKTRELLADYRYFIEK